MPVGGNLHAIEADVQDYKVPKAAAAEVAEVTGSSLDVLINNAARAGRPLSHVPVTESAGGEEEAEEEEEDLVYSINAFLGMPLLSASSAPPKRKSRPSPARGTREFALKMQHALLVGYAAKVTLNVAVTKNALQLEDEGFVCVLVWSARARQLWGRVSGPFSCYVGAHGLTDEQIYAWMDAMGHWMDSGPRGGGVRFRHQSVPQVEAERPESV
ncbi:hypothetical protein OF83DRAFT_1189403 [Amylostereum chailletii]|nr:hypothetical protein OF83DRAFT_1189403 [Amylostereum chailletii]